jgi:nitrite reductase/ring-hydroxylating ferredoxin subunit
MHVVKISTTGTGNCAEVNQIPYVYASTSFGAFVLPARCPHRGGPLHLARVEGGGHRLICPWHGRATSVARAARRGLPAVRRGDRVSIVFPGDDPGDCVIAHRPLSPDISFHPKDHR